MKYVFLVIIHLLFIHTKVNSQTYWIPKKALYEFLYTTSETFTHLKFDKEELFLPTTKKNNIRIIGSLAKNKNGLFITVFGTGQVYKATALREKEMAITRIDSTIFWGGNFLSYDFSYNDTLYSFGGYGFWKFNGQLRYFTEGGEWQIFKLNEEHILNSDLSYIDTKTGNLYYGQKPIKIETEEKEIETFSVYQLDIKTKRNKLLGELDLPFNILNSTWTFNHNGLDGSILFLKGDWYLLQFSKNKVYILKEKKIIDFLNISSRYNHDVMFGNGDSIHIYSNVEDSLRSTSISLNDFEIQTSSIYKPYRNSKYDIYFIVSGISISLAFLTLYYFKKRKKNNTNNKIDKNHIAEIENSLDTIEFTELEKLIIDNILTKSKVNTTMNVEELNRILGLGKKTLEIQKKSRREILNRINHKYKKLFFQNTDLIENIRSSHDRRFYNYLINSKNIEILDWENKKNISQL